MRVGQLIRLAVLMAAGGAVVDFLTIGVRAGALLRAAVSLLIVIVIGFVTDRFSPGDELKAATLMGIVVGTIQAVIGVGVSSGVALQRIAVGNSGRLESGLILFGGLCATLPIMSWAFAGVATLVAWLIGKPRRRSTSQV